MIAGEEPQEMHPWYRGFTGDIQAKTGKDSRNYTVSGGYEEIDNQTLIINELPVGKWTTDYKQMLETMMVGGDKPAPKEDNAFGGAVSVIVKDFKENHTDTTVRFTVTVVPGNSPNPNSPP
jgi:DNA topoisomerase-2